MQSNAHKDKHHTSKVPPAKRSQIIHEGCLLLFNMKVDDAILFFEKIKDQDLHFEAMTIFCKFMLVIMDNSPDQNEKEKISDEMNRMIEKFEKHSFSQSLGDDFISVFKKKEYQDPTVMQEYAAMQGIAFFYLLLATIEFLTSSYIKAAVSLRRSWKSYEEAYLAITHFKGNKDLIDPHYIADINFGFAFFNFSFSLFPPNLMFIVEALGFKADRKGGWSLLNEVALSTCLSGCLACFMLQANTQFWLLDYDKALKIFEYTQIHFPGNMPSMYIGALSYRFQGNIENAEKCIGSVLHSVSQIPQFELLCNYELGTTAIKYSDWKKALPYLEKFHQNNKSEMVRCICAYELGVTYWFLNKSDQAKECFKMCLKWERREVPMEEHMARKAKQYLTRDVDQLLDKFDMLFFEAVERFKISEWDQCIEFLKQIQETGLLTNSKERKACCDLFLGRCYRRKNDLNFALPYLEEAFNAKVKHENWITPHALFEIGVIHFLNKDNEKAIKCFNKVKNHYDGYDFRNILLREVALWSDKANGVTYHSFC